MSGSSLGRVAMLLHNDFTVDPRVEKEAQKLVALYDRLCASAKGVRSPGGGSGE